MNYGTPYAYGVSYDPANAAMNAYAPSYTTAYAPSYTPSASVSAAGPASAAAYAPAPMPAFYIPKSKPHTFAPAYAKPRELVRSHWWMKGYSYASTLKDSAGVPWWAPIATVGIVYGLTIALTIPLVLLVALSFIGQASLSDFPSIVGTIDDGDLNPVAILFLFGSVAIMLPALWLSIYYQKCQSFGSLSSVFGHIRWKALGWSTLVALVGMSAYLAISIVQMLASGEKLEFKAPSVVAIILIFTLIPVQCITEEYIFRGVLLQAFGKWLPRFLHILVPIVPALIFASMHSQYDIVGKTSVFAMGIFTGYAAMYLGGLEAGMGLHIANNIIATISAAIIFENDSASQITWASVGLDVLTQAIIIAAIIVGANIFHWFDDGGVDVIGALSRRFGVQRPSHIANLEAKQQAKINQAILNWQMQMMQMSYTPQMQTPYAPINPVTPMQVQTAAHMQYTQPFPAQAQWAQAAPYTPAPQAYFYAPNAYASYMPAPTSAPSSAFAPTPVPASPHVAQPAYNYPYGVQGNGYERPQN